MATQVQWRRGTNAQIAAFTGAQGEVAFNTTTDRLHAQDGVTQGGFAHSLVSDVQALSTNFAVAGGTSDTLTVSLSPAPTGYGNGNGQIALVWFKATATSTTATPTLSVNGLGAKTVQKNGGALAAGDIASGSSYAALYDGTYFQLLGVKPVSAATPGATVTNPMPSNLVLTVSSKQVQTVAPNAAGLAIQLPDATTMPSAGAVIFELNNITTNGAFPTQILDSASTVIGWSLPGGRTLVHLDSTATATGGWRLQSGDRSQDNGWYEYGGPLLQTTTHGGYESNIQLDSQYGVRFYGTNSSNFYCAGYKIGDPVTEISGSPSTITTGLLGFDAVRVSATEAFVIWYDTAANQTKCCTVDINTGTLATTVNTAVTVDATVPTINYLCCDVISSSLVLTGFATGNTATKAATVSISAGACTVNAATTLWASSNNNPMDVAVLSSTLAHFNVPNGNTAQFYRVTLSGTAITGVGTAVTVSSRTLACITKVSATVSAVGYTDSTSGTAILCNILTDTGSAISTNEITISAAETGSAASGAASPTYCNALQPGMIVAFKPMGSAAGMSVGLIHPTASTAPMTPLLLPKAFRQGMISSVRPSALKAYNNTGLLSMTAYGNAAVDLSTPICFA